MRRVAKSALLGGLLIFCAVVALKGAALFVPTGTWAPEGTMANTRSGASAVLLPDGRILITGGDTGSGPVVTADILDTNGATSSAPPMISARTKHVSVALQDGRVLVAGGTTAGGSATSSAEIFDPIANSWTNVGIGMNEARSGATAALLQDGRVLIAGGQNGTAISSTLEIFDPALDVFAYAGTMSSPRTQHAMIALQDGRVLIVGGNNGTAPVASTEIFDPVTATLNTGPSLGVARFGHTATTLLNGQVAVIGGNNGNANPAQADVTPAELFDPVAGTFTTLATNLATPREGHLAFLLPDNNSILIAGGTSAGTAITSAELFLPQATPTGVWSYSFAATGSMTTARSGASGSANQVNATSTVLQRNGVLMVAGGADASGNALNTTEAYGYATVQTDQSDYAPYQTVTISGSGWVPGETVTLSFVESPYFDTHPTLTAVADANGSIVNTDFAPDDHDLNIRFYLTAAGSQSQAQNTFTDSSHLTGVVVGTQSPAGISPGSSATYLISFTSNGSGADNGTLSVTSGLPAGATASFSPNPVDTSSATSTLTIATTVSTPPGTYTFTVRAVADATVTNTGTLIVSGPATKVQVETKPDGTGTVVPAQNVTAGGSVTAYAIERDAANNFVANVAATWSLINKTGGVANTDLAPSGDTKSAVLTGHLVGTAQIQDVAGSFTGNSGTLTVLAGTATKLVFTTSAQTLTAGVASATITVQRQDQFGNANSTDATRTVTLSSSSGGTATFTPPSPISIPAGSSSASFTYKDTAPGTPTITAASTSPTTITSATQIETVNADATTTSISAPTITYNANGSVTVSVTSTAGTVTGNVSLSVDGGTAVAKALTSGSATFTNTDIAALVSPSAGSHSLSASYAAQGIFGTSSATGTLTVNKATPTLSVTNSPVTYNGSPQAATVSGSVPGTVSNIKYGGSATVPTNAATYGITADFAPTDTTDYNSLSGASAGNFVINKATPTLSVTNSPVTYNGSAQAAAVSGSVAGTVSSVQYNGSATVPMNAATYAVTANFTPTDTTDYNSLSGASAGNFVINKATPTLSVTNSPVTYNGSPQAATVSSSVPGTVSNIKYGGSATVPTNAATYGITADFAPTDTTDYNSLSGASAGNFVINKATPTLSVTNSPVTYNGSAQAAAVSGSVAGTVSSVQYNGSATVPTNAATYAVTANFTPTDTTDYNSLSGASAGNFVINKATPTLSVTNSPVTYNGSPQAATVSSSVPGTVSNIKYGGSATVPTNAATYGITADFAPTDTTDYNSLSGASAGNFVINKATPTLSVTNSPVTYNGSAQAAAVSGSVAGTVSSVQYNGSATVPTNAATYAVTANFTPTDTTDYNSLSGASAGNFVINKATPTLSVTNSPVTYNGSAQAAAVSGSVAGTVSGVQYNGSATVPTNAATYAVTANFTPTDTTDYNSLSGASAGNFVINKATPTLSATNSPVTYNGSAQAATVSGSAAGTVSSVQYNGSATVPTNAATYAVTANFTPTDTTNYNSLTAASAGNFVINKATPTLSVTNSPVTYNGSPQAATVSGSVPGAASNVKYGGSATVPTNAGTYAITADFTPTDTTNYSSLSAASAGNFVINKAASTVTFAAAPTPTYLGGNFTVSATTTNTDSATLTYSQVSGPCGFVSGATFSSSGAGICVVQASGAATTNFLAASNTQSVTIGKATPAFSPALTSPGAITYGTASVSLPSDTSVMVKSGSTRAGSPDTVTITINGVSSAPINFSGGSGTFGPINFPTSAIPVGTYPITFTYSGGTNFNSITDTSTTLTVNKAAATVMLTNLTQTYTGSPLSPTVTTAPAGLSFSLTGAPDTGAGTYPVTATVTDPNYTGTASDSFVINKAAATVTLSNLTQMYTGSPLSPTVTTTPTGLSFSLTGAPDTSAGTYPVTATVTDPNYTGTASDSFVINKAAATVTLSNLTQTYTGNPLSPTVTTTPTGLSLSLTGAPDTNAGSYPVTATVTDPNYTGTASGSFVINKAAATVTLSNLTQTYTGSPLSPTVTTTPTGLSFSLTGAPDTSAGTYPVAATITDPNYVGSASDSFVINKAAATVTLSNLTQTYTGNPLSPTVTTTPTGLSLSLTGAPDTNAGSYPVTATVTDSNYQGSASGTFTINQAIAVVMLSNLSQNYDGTPKSVTVVTSPLGLSVMVTYNGSATPPTDAGSYTVSASVVDANYQGSALATLVINAAASSTTVSSSENPSNYGDSVSFVATVSSTAGTPTGTVQFVLDGSNSGSPVTLSGGTATSAATTSLAAGQHTVTAVYGGTTDFTGGTSPFLIQTVNNALTSITVTPATPSIFVGGAQQFTATGTFADDSSAILPAGGTWAIGNSLTSAVRAPMAATGSNGTLYFFGGQDGSGAETFTQTYNPTTGLWGSAASMLNARYQGVAVPPGDGLIYVIGGWQSTPTDFVEAYNPGTNTWVSKTNVPHMSGCSVGGAVNGKIYVLTGCDGTAGFSKEFDVYNPTTGTWSSLPSPVHAHNSGVGGVIGGKFYVEGGYDVSNATDITEVYDPQTNSWSTLASAPAALGELSGGIMGGKLYAVGGLDNSSNPQSSVYVYDPGANTWSAGPSLSQGRRDIGLATLDGLLYAAGGFTTSSSNALEILDTDDVTWASDIISVATVDPSAGLGMGVSQGTATIAATSGNFPSVTGSTVLTVQKKNQTITFGALADKTYGDPDFAVSATSDSGLTVTFTASGNCTVSGTTVHITSAGSCTITAQQAGDNAYNPATDVPQTFTIARANAVISVTPYSVTYDGNPHTAAGTATGVESPTPASLTSLLHLGGTTHTSAGDYPSDAWTFDGNTNYNATSGTVHDAIAKANAVISVTPYSVTYDGNPHTAAGTATGVESPTPASLTSLLHLGGTTHTSAGDYPSDAWTFDGNTNYNATSGTVHDAIAKANAAISVTPYSVTYDGNPHTATGTATGVESPTPASLTSLLHLGGTTHTSAGDYPSDAWTFDGDTNYNATSGTVHDAIAKANAVISVTPYSVTYDGNPHTATGTATGVEFPTPANLTAQLNLGGTTHTNAGTYGGDYWTFTDTTGNYNSVAATTIADNIAKASSTTTVTFEIGSYVYRGTAFTATATVAGAGGLSASVTPVVYTGDCTNVTSANGCTAAATFAGDTNHTSSSDSESITVTQAPSATVVSCPASVTYSGSTQMPCSATVTGSALSQILIVVYANNTNAGPAVASAGYPGDTNHTGSSGSANFIIMAASTSTVVSSSPNPSNWGNVVTLTARVTNTSTGAPPTGSVSFYNVVSTASCSSLGTITWSDTEPLMTVDSLQQASTSTPNLPVGPGNTAGTDTILSCYNYNATDPNFNANFVASSGTTTQTVNPAPIATLVPTNLSFGGQQGGTISGAQTITVCNGPSGAPGAPCSATPVSTAVLLIASIGFTNPNTSTVYFTQTSTCPIGGTTGLAVGGSCAINVKFAPPLNAQGIATALLTVIDDNENVLGSTQSASLVGAGTSAVVGVGSLSTYAIFATANGCSSVNVSGNGTVDSFGGSTNSGNIGTNGNATLSGNPVVNGAVYSPIGGTDNCSSKTMTGLSTSGKAQATGGLHALPGPVTYPLPPAPNPAPPTTNQTISGSCGSISGCTPIGSKSVNLAAGQYGNLNVSGGTSVHVKAGTYNVNSLTLSGNSILYVDSGLVVINLAGASLNGNSPAMDLSGGSIVNPSAITSNLQFYYGGSSSIKLSGGSGSYALVYAPNSAIIVSGGSHFYGSIIGSTVNSSGNTAIHYDAALPSISSGNSIWFTSSGLTVKGLPSTGSVKLYVTNASISFPSTSSQCTGSGTSFSSGQCTLPVPNGVITFSSTATSGSTTWDATNKRWSTIVPTSSVNNVASIHTFLDGVAFQVPSGGFPAGIQNVTWQAAFSTTYTGTPGNNFSFNWQWGAAVYSMLPAAGTTGDYSPFSVSPLDNSDPAGTPETYKSNLVFGDMGAGYVGLYANFAGVSPTIAPMNLAPSSYDFGLVPMGNPTATVPFVLTNNDSVPYTINSIQMTGGTYAGDFALAQNGSPNTPNNCLSVTSLASGGNCTLYVTFTPSTSSGTKETAKIVINDGANNSPQTVFLKGTVN